jgi:two-component system sensor histidine kinase PhoQ
MRRSLSGRLLAGVFILLILFFGITVAALDTVFHRLSDQAMHNRLEGQLVALIAASDPDASGMVHPDAPLAEPRFETPGSGLYGTIEDSSGKIIWRSRSAVAVSAPPAAHAYHASETEAGVPAAGPPGAGQRRFERVREAGTEWEKIRMIVDWEMSRGKQRSFTFTVAENLQPYLAQIQSFRVQLLGWFGVLTFLLLVAVSILLRRALQPLRRLESEISAIERGERAALSEGYPRELAGVSKNLNNLLGSERKRAERYRQTLGNLAHELKTPLAIMRNQPGVDGALIERMDQIVAHQLRRARISAGSTLGQTPLDLAAIVKELLATLNKVYAAKGIMAEVGGTAVFAGDRGDTLELIGNLLDNAYKWARRRVTVDIRTTFGGGAGAPAARQCACIVIEDDGPGWGKADPGALFERGVRADETRPGHGLGLSIVQDLVEAYDGSILAGVGPAGGARIELRLPAPKDVSAGGR